MTQNRPEGGGNYVEDIRRCESGKCPAMRNAPNEALVSSLAEETRTGCINLDCRLGSTNVLEDDLSKGGLACVLTKRGVTCGVDPYPMGCARCGRIRKV